MKTICPDCAGERIRRSHRRDRIEIILSWAGVLPLRCEDCEERFFRFRPKARHSRLSETEGLPHDRRHHERSAWDRLSRATKTQVIGYAAGILVTLAFFLWLAWWSLD